MYSTETITSKEIIKKQGGNPRLTEIEKLICNLYSVAKRQSNLFGKRTCIQAKALDLTKVALMDIFYYPKAPGENIIEVAQKAKEKLIRLNNYHKLKTASSSDRFFWERDQLEFLIGNLFKIVEAFYKGNDSYIVLNKKAEKKIPQYKKAYKENSNSVLVEIRNGYLDYDDIMFFQDEPLTGFVLKKTAELREVISKLNTLYFRYGNEVVGEAF